MFITVAAFKGGVGKTTTAVHLAAYLQADAPTMLVDADENRSACRWAKLGKLSFIVAAATQAPRYYKQVEHIVMDTKARPTEEELKELAESCDLLIVPTTPKAMDMDVMMQTVEMLRGMEEAKFKVFLTMVPPTSNVGKEIREVLKQADIPVFQAEVKRFKAFEDAPMQGLIVKDFANSHAKSAWQGYEALGKEILP